MDAVYSLHIMDLHPVNIHIIQR